MNQDGQDCFRIFRIVGFILDILLHPEYPDSKLWLDPINEIE
ncbi:Uncharacterized protein dnl_55030 [Desulfonema limicola]|uniref:Uncharacterized protein n=1 Tax=Desulfonema limicola TaxID=45656 RepID=A0A975BDD6_9BACT|nr:Uncharacterized protein dnl_55030 [Desulfonema limicola]